MTYTPPHPVVFVFDPCHSNVRVPDVAEEVVTANETCISIRTLADVDGDVTVHLASNVMPQNISSRSEVFNGDVETPSMHVAVVTSENQILLDLPVSKRICTVRVWVDDRAFPSEIWVEASDD